MTALTMIVSLSAIVAATMFCFNRIELALLPSLIIGNVFGIFVGSILETGSFAAASGMNVLVLGILLAPVLALVFGTGTTSNPYALAANSMTNVDRTAPAECGIVTTAPAESQVYVRAA